MGAKSSTAACSNSSCDVVCNCFVNDPNVRNIEIKRDCRIKWIWSNKHDSILYDSLALNKSNDYNVPNDLISMIKDFTYSNSPPIIINKTRICNEKYYKNPKQLIKKPLCSTYFASLPMSRQLSIVLIGKNGKSKQNVIDKFRDQHFPGLQSPYSSNDDLLRRTIIIDGVQIRSDLISIESMDELDESVSNHDNDNFVYIMMDNLCTAEMDSICTHLWTKNRSMNNCILFSLSNKLNTKLNNLAIQWNVPFINPYTLCSCFNKQKLINHLFLFSVKHYWFGQVNKPSVLL